jgi:hypothetical protein
MEWSVAGVVATRLNVNCHGVMIADIANHRGKDDTVLTLEVLRGNSWNPH